MGCQTYCGCATRANKAKWSVFAVTLVAGLSCIAAYFGVVFSCSAAQPDVSDVDCPSEEASFFDYDYGLLSTQAARDDCIEQAEVAATVECIADKIGTLLLLELLAIMSFILCSIPLYMMCCCSEPPRMAADRQEAYNAIELRTAAPAPATVTPATPEKPQKARFKAPGPAATAWGALARTQPDRRNDAASGAEARTDSSDALLALDPS